MTSKNKLAFIFDKYKYYTDQDYRVKFRYILKNLLKIARKELFNDDEEPVAFQDYFELVPFMSEKQFIQDFRMPKSHFEILHAKLVNSPSFQCTGKGKAPVYSEKCLAIGIWVLATPDSYRSIARRFAVTKSTVKCCLERVINGLLNEFEVLGGEEGGLQKVIGALDGCHIKIRAPARGDKSVYFNRKKDYSIVLQGLCDADCFFTNVDVRWPGSVHDARAFTTSDLYPLCEDICRNGYYFIGDSAYPLKSYLMRPYRRTHRLSLRQKLYNKILSKTRQVIERAFGFLKTKFRRLYYLHRNNVRDSVRTIAACCILHNICLASEEYARILIFGRNENENDEPMEQNLPNNIVENPNRKRQQIVDRLWNLYAN
ncbi:uncharacterized protein LOC131665891 [Phymastichus coffea]|uniref:uncharacterized protein LOC131665891 n=1 Tax=Phymastichus coffea TaxID=108790 RepID=UPI00273CA177|nr:uncharacterized protein LOC131665891 [Phymastichus coffea]